MLSRSGKWVGSSVAGLTLARFWLFQDFTAGSGPGLTISQNDNGSGGLFSFDSSRIVDSSAVVTDTSGDPIYNSATAIPANLVSVSTHTGTAVTLSGTPHSSYGSVRIWYLYAMSTAEAPLSLEVAPRFVKEVRSQFLDNQYLNQGLSLSDIGSASSGRTNLGFSAQTAGRVLLGDGGTTFTSDSALFFDTSNDRLGIGTASPSQHLHVFHATVQPIALIEAQITGSPPIVRLQAARASNANLANADVVGQLDFYGRFNSTTGALATIECVYTGNGTTQKGDIVFLNANSGSPSEVFRITAAGGIDTVLGAGAVSSDSSGVLSSGTLSIANGGTNATSLTAGAAISTGTALATEAQLAITRGGTALSAVGTTNQLFGTNAAANAFEHKAVQVTAAGVMAILPGLVSAPTIGFTDSATTGLYSSATGSVALTAAGTQCFVSTSSLTTIPLATLFKISLAIEDPGAGTGAVTFQAATGTTSHTLTLPGTQGSANMALVNNGSGALSWSPGIPYKAGVVSLSTSTTSKAVTFGTAFGSTSYAIFATLKNTTDASPLLQPVLVIAKASTGFTVEWNEALDSANYVLEWMIAGSYDP